MSTGVERARGLERDGIAGPIASGGICPLPRCTKKRSGATRALIAADGPLACRTGQHTGRSPNDKFVVREPSSEARHRLGQGQPADGAGAVRPAAPRSARLARTARTCSCSTASPAPTRSTGCRSASSTSSPGTTCSARNLFIDDRGAAAQAARRSSRSSTRRASRPIRSVTARTPRSSSRVNFAKRLVLIGGTSYAGEMKKSIFTRAQLPPAAAERAADALLGQRRRRRGRRAVLRPVGHRQDDALERSRARG